MEPLTDLVSQIKVEFLFLHILLINYFSPQFSPTLISHQLRALWALQPFKPHPSPHSLFVASI